MCIEFHEYRTNIHSSRIRCGLLPAIFTPINELTESMTQLPIYSGPATQTAELPAQPVTDDAADPAFGTGELIKTTTSICPECLEKIDATVYELSLIHI